MEVIQLRMVVIFLLLIAELALSLNLRSGALMSQLPGCTLAMGTSIIVVGSKWIWLVKVQAGVCVCACLAPPPVGITFARSGKSFYNPPWSWVFLGSLSQCVSCASASDHWTEEHAHTWDLAQWTWNWIGSTGSGQQLRTVCPWVLVLWSHSNACFFKHRIKKVILLNTCYLH